MNKRILLSLAVIALAAALIGGVTAAWFSDDVALSDEDATESVGAGTLLVDFDDETEAEEVSYAMEDFDVMNLGPNDVWEYNIDVENVGTLDFEYKMKLGYAESTGQQMGLDEVLDDLEFGSDDYDDFGTENISDVIRVTIECEEEGYTPVDYELLSEAATEDDGDFYIDIEEDYRLDAANADSWNIEMELDTDETGNEHQGGELNFDLTILAKQLEDDEYRAEYVQDIDAPHTLLDDPVEFSVSPESIDLQEGDSDSITVEDVYPADAEIDFASSDEDVAVVDGDGNVDAVEAGSAQIVVEGSADDYRTTTESVDVTVTEMQPVQFDVPESIQLQEGDEDSVAAENVDPADADISYESSDESVVTVDGDGNVEAGEEGNAVIEVTGEADDHETTVKEIDVAVVSKTMATPIEPMVQEYPWDENVWYCDDEGSWMDGDEPISYPSHLLNPISTEINEEFDFAEIGAESAEVENIWLYSQDQGQFIELKEPGPVAGFLGVQPEDVTVEDGTINMTGHAVGLLEENVNALSEAVQVGAPIMPEVQFEGQPVPEGADDAFEIDPDWTDEELIQNALGHDRVPFINFVVPLDE